MPRDELKEAFRINDDGAGFMFNDPVSNKVKVFKGWFGFRRYYKSLRTCERSYPNSTFVIHMRIGTSGSKGAENCHPFLVSDYAGFAHNGVMFGLGDKGRSDTREFVEDTLAKLPDNFWEYTAIRQAIEKCATASGSKFALLIGDGSYFIFNEGAGHWKDGVWFSNSSYKIITIKHTTHTYTGDAGMCMCCHKAVKPDDVAFSHLYLHVCRSCLNTLAGTMQIPCETCNMNSPLTKELLYGEEIHCRFCHTTFQHDDVAWHLMSALKED